MTLGPRPTLTMHNVSTPDRSLRLLTGMGAAAALLLLATACAWAQTLPPTAPTSLTNLNTQPSPLTGAPTNGNTPGNTLQHHKAGVTYANGLLGVQADDSSLNQILRDIARETGMTIVGGVTEQRIFGNYGPGAPATVLQTLLDGTGANMLLKETATEGPVELILTPRTGNLTPPGPNSSLYDSTENEPPLPQPGGSASPLAARPPASPDLAPNHNGPRTNPPAPAASATVKTPQQIYEELKQLQQKQAAAKQASPAPAAGPQARK